MSKFRLKERNGYYEIQKRKMFIWKTCFAYLDKRSANTILRRLRIRNVIRPIRMAAPDGTEVIEFPSTGKEKPYVLKKMDKDTQAITVDVNKKPNVEHTYEVNRFELIDHTQSGSGREIVEWKNEPFNVQLDLQDNGRTLKVFLKDKEN